MEPLSSLGSDPVVPTAGPGPRTLAAITIAAAGSVVLSVALALTSGHLTRPVLQAVLINWITVPYLVSGVLAWTRRPDSRLGPLMVTTGLMTSLITLEWSNVAGLIWVGHLVDLVPAALFLHVYLAFPTGRLRSRTEQILVGLGYGTTFGLQLAKVLLGIAPGDRLAKAHVMLVSLLLLAGAARLALRRRGLNRPARRVVALTVDAFGLSLVMLAILYLAAVRSWPMVEVVRNLTFAALGLAPVAFLLGLLDARLARADVADLVVQLRTHPTSDLQAHLAKALHDPTVRVAYWLPQFNTWADQEGKHIPPPPGTGDASRAVRLIRHAEEPVAALVFDTSLLEERELLDAVTAAAGIALENGRLQAELRARLSELQESRARVLEAGRTERQRLERNLHDGAQQRLVTLTLELGMLGQHLTEPADKAQVERVRAQVAESLQELRDVARGIYPAVLAGHGLDVALESLAARAPVPVRLHLHLEKRPPEPVEIAAYYLVSEALANTGKHAHASSATVRVTHRGHSLTVEVTDDGIGGTDIHHGTGLRGLADRVEALGGTLHIRSPHHGGTQLIAEIPCPAPGATPSTEMEVR